MKGVLDMQKKDIRRLMNFIQIFGMILILVSMIARIRTDKDIFNYIILIGLVFSVIGDIYLRKNKEAAVKKQTGILYRVAIVAIFFAIVILFLSMNDVIKNFDITEKKTQLFIGLIVITVGLVIYTYIAYRKAPLIETEQMKGDGIDGEEETK